MSLISMKIRAGVVAAMACAGTASGQDWEHTGGPLGGQVGELGAGSGYAFAATAGGLARFDPLTGSWQVLASSQWIPPGSASAVQSIATVPGAVLVSTTTGALIRSFDNGETWHELPGHGQPTSLYADGNRLYSSSPAGLRRSLDQGTTWLPVNFVPGAGFYASGDVLLSGGFDTYWVSLDGGQTSQTFPLPPVGFAVPTHFASTSHGLYMAVNSLTSSSGRIFRSTNQGASFQQIATVGGVEELLVKDDTIYILTEEQTTFTNRLWTSANGTLTEAGVVPPGFQSIRDLRMAFLGGDLLVGTPDVGALRSTDGGQTWGAINNGLGFTRVSNMAAGDGVALAGLISDHSIWRYQGGVWTPSAPLPGGGNIFSIHHLGGPNFIAGTNSEGIFRSGDGGVTWTASSAGLPQYNGSAGLQYREVEDITHNGVAVFAGLGAGTEMINGQFRLSGGGLVRSTDGGATWERANNGLPVIMTNNFGQPVFDPFISLVSLGQAIFAGADSTGIFRSTNNGASWEAVSPLVNVTDMATLEGAVYAASAEGLFVSTDGGTSWVELGFPGTPRALAAAGGDLYASAAPALGFGGGVYQSSDGGQNWVQTGTLFDAMQVPALAAEGGTVFAGTDGLGVWTLHRGLCDPDITTGAIQGQPGYGIPNGILNNDDFFYYLAQFAAGNLAVADLTTGAVQGQPGYGVPNGILNNEDFFYYLAIFAAGC